MVGNLIVEGGGVGTGRGALSGVVIRRRIIGWRRNHIDGLVDRLGSSQSPGSTGSPTGMSGMEPPLRERGLVHVRNGVITLTLRAPRSPVYS